MECAREKKRAQEKMVEAKSCQEQWRKVLGELAQHYALPHQDSPSQVFVSATGLDFLLEKATLDQGQGSHQHHQLQIEIFGRPTSHSIWKEAQFQKNEQSQTNHHTQHETGD